MKPRFREDKTTQAAAVLLRGRGGRMSYMKLLKLLYLADREALLRWGRPITFDAYVSMRNGPVLSRTYELISSGVPPEEPSPWRDCISEPSGYRVSLVAECATDKLSDAEEGLLEEVFRSFGSLSRWQLVDYSHGLSEWTDPGDSAIPIDYQAILLAGGKSLAEAADIVGELEALALADVLFE
jgi:uncharacterized phage-associated protein